MLLRAGPSLSCRAFKRSKRERPWLSLACSDVTAGFAGGWGTAKRLAVTASKQSRWWQTVCEHMSCAWQNSVATAGAVDGRGSPAWLTAAAWWPGDGAPEPAVSRCGGSDSAPPGSRCASAAHPAPAPAPVRGSHGQLAVGAYCHISICSLFFKELLASCRTWRGHD